MDQTPLNDYITLLQSKTLIIDSYTRELQIYTTLFDALKIELTIEQFHELQKCLLSATSFCDQLDKEVQRVVQELQTILCVTETFKADSAQHRKNNEERLKKVTERQVK